MLSFGMGPREDGLFWDKTGKGDYKRTGCLVLKSIQQLMKLDNIGIVHEKREKFYAMCTRERRGFWVLTIAFLLRLYYYIGRI